MELSTLVRGMGARSGLRPAPLSLGFELTHRCNLDCAYCDRHAPLPFEMTREQIYRALTELYELGMRHVSLDGGEPLLHRDVDEVVAFLVTRRVRVYMNSNGILVPRRRATVRLLSKLKVSLDGPPEAHDRIRGAGAYDKAVRGALAARELGTAVELTAVVGAHNLDCLDELLDRAAELGLQVVFQPARNSLFLGSSRPGAPFQSEPDAVRRAFRLLEARKLAGHPAVGNRWSSLRHFREFPRDVRLPCAAGIINATLDPEGNLYHCGQVARSGGQNVVRLGAKAAFENLVREGCTQCWCARVVEENVAWGGAVHRMLPPLGVAEPGPKAGPRRLKVVA